MSTWGDYQIVKNLGKGAYSEVMLAKHKDTGEKWALKVMMRSCYDKDTLAVVQNEIKTMKSLSHPNIINLIDSSDTAEFVKANGVKREVFYLALELASGGELFDLIAQTGRFSEETARFYFHQLWDAFEYMHEKGISHRDMKLENIMLSSDFNLKVADFGFSSDKPINKSLKGTESYMSPEIHLGKKYSGKSADLFAAGIILFSMVTQTPPFHKAVNSDSLYKMIYANRVDLFWKVHSRNKPGGLEFYSPSLIDLISSMFSVDPVHRPSLAEIRAHEWYNGPVPTYEEIKEEFSKRHSDWVNSNLQSDASIPEEVYEPSVFAGHSTHRGLDGDEENDEQGLSLKRQAAMYTPEFRRYSQFFSTSNLEELFRTLVVFSCQLTSEYKFADDEYSVDLVFIEDNSKIELTVNILQLENEGKYCVEAIKNSGDRFAFNDLYNKMKEYFGGHVNATE